MALLGSSVDPRLFLQDYSGFTRAAEIQAQGMQNLGAAIGQGIKDFGEARQERKKLDAQIKADSASIESAMKLGDSLGIDIKSYLAPIQAKINDPNTTPMEAAAYGRAAAQGISNAFTLGIGAQERQSAQQRAMIDQQYRMADLALKGEKVDIARMQAEKGPAPKFTVRRPILTSPTGEQYEGPEMTYDENRGMYFDTKAQRHIKDVNLIGTGQEYAPEEPVMPTPTSQNEIIAPSTAYSFGKAVGGPDELQDKWTNKGYTSTGPNLVEGVVAVNTNKYPLGTIFKDSESGKVYVAADRHGNKDSSVIDFFQNPENYTGDRVNKRLSIIGAVPKNKIPKTREGMSQLIEQYSNVPDYSTSSNASQIDNAISMGGDMTQQAMGTPEQQAMAAQQIEQGQQFATTQAGQGMPTEPSMATQQPQLPQQAAPKWSPPPGFAPVRPQGNKPTTKMTAEQVANLAAQGFKVNAIPNADGTFTVSGVSTGGSSSGFEVTTPEGTTVKYGGAGGLTQPKIGQGLQLVPDPTSPTGTRAVPIPGGEAEKAAQQEAAAAEIGKARGVELGLVAIAEIDNFINYTDKMSKLPFASPARQAFATFGMEEQAEAESSLNTVKSNLKFEALDALRKASPSGASGLGQVTQNEFSALAEQWGDLRLKGNPEKIKERAIRIKKQFLDIVHGSQKHRDLLLKKGVITEQQYNEIQSQYPGSKVASQEDANLSRWRKAFTPQPTQ